jgi:Protein of unknown function (DUF998)
VFGPSIFLRKEKAIPMSVAEFPTTFSPTRAAGLTRPAHLDRAAHGALAGAVAAVPPITLLHLAATDPVEPSGWTISDYVVSLPHGTLLFALTTGALAIGAGALAHGLAVMSGTGRARALLVLWAAGLLIAAAFPTNRRGTPQDLSSNIHLYAGAVTFAALPIAAWLLARRLRRDAGHRGGPAAVLGGFALVGGLLSAALIANRLPGVFGLTELMLPPGILQRVAGAAQIAMLAMAAIAVLRTRSARAADTIAR